jgi:subtilisin family serine protease
MVGDDGVANQVGMAPGARWIGCRNMNKGVGTPATYAECFQWFVAPTRLDGSEPRPDLAPDVINNSWVCPPSEGCSWDSLKLVIENTRQAGILVVASAGNSGSSCDTVSDPPAIYDASFTIGATDSSDGIAEFSSRGPASYTSLRKPDVSAPGVDIRSSIPGGWYSRMSGTSMAGPHVAGLVALIISVRPDLKGKVDIIETLIEHSALPLASLQDCGGISGASIPNNTYGWGRIDAWTTYLRLQNIYYFPIIYR